MAAKKRAKPMAPIQSIKDSRFPDVELIDELISRVAKRMKDVTRDPGNRLATYATRLCNARRALEKCVGWKEKMSFADRSEVLRLMVKIGGPEDPNAPTRVEAKAKPKEA